MSPISSTQDSSLSQFLQNITSNGAAPAPSSSSGSTPTSAIANALQKIGHHRHQGGGFDKLANAVTKALQSAGNASGGSLSTDANQTITQALTKIFSNGSLGGDTDQDASPPSAVSNNATSASAATTLTQSALPPAFVQTLQSFGVTPQQFQNDLSAALKASQDTGSFDISSAFKSFPVGSVVDSIG